MNSLAQVASLGEIFFTLDGSYVANNKNTGTVIRVDNNDPVHLSPDVVSLQPLYFCCSSSPLSQHINLQCVRARDFLRMHACLHISYLSKSTLRSRGLCSYQALGLDSFFILSV